MILIKGGRVLTETGIEVADVLVEGNRVARIDANIASRGVDETIGAEGCLVGPGFVDIHVHFREPGQTWKEDMATGSAAAAAGGFTAVVVMPNTEPAIDSVDLVRQVKARGEEIGLVQTEVAAAFTRGRQGSSLVDFESLHEAGVRIFTDDGDSIMSAVLMGEILERVGRLEGAIVSQHAEDHSRTGAGHMHDGTVSQRLGISGLSSAAESDVVFRDLELTKRTRTPYHCQHVSAASTVDLIRSAKAEGLPVTAEVTPHHLSFTDEDVAEIGTNLKMYPPVRTDSDRSSLRRALVDGTIDVVATDHAPHSADEKAASFEDAPRGVIGLETSAAVASSVLHDPQRFFEAMSVMPARLARMERQGIPPAEGAPANLVVFDPELRWTPREFVSKARNSPYGGRQLKGKTLATIFEGTITYMEAVRID